LRKSGKRKQGDKGGTKRANREEGGRERSGGAAYTVLPSHQRRFRAPYGWCLAEGERGGRRRKKKG